VRFLPDPCTAQKYELGSRAGIKTWALIARNLLSLLFLSAKHPNLSRGL
jgi:hypothetical protein